MSEPKTFRRIKPQGVMLESFKKQIRSLRAHHKRMPFDDVTEEAAVHDGKSYEP